MNKKGTPNLTTSTTYYEVAGWALLVVPAVIESTTLHAFTPIVACVDGDIQKNTVSVGTVRHKLSRSLQFQEKCRR
jgi:hypothetical protein